MDSRKWCNFLVAGWLAGAPGWIAAQPSPAPQVIATTPTLNARAVDPSLEAIEVLFDQPMQPGSWSWCGGGEQFPELTGKPFYRDEFTAVLPVKLKPQHSYMLSINCANAQGFRSRQGASAEPVPFRFTTSSGDGFPAHHPKNHASLREFRLLFSQVYSYHDRTGSDWEALFDENEEWLLSATTPEEQMRRLATLLGAARDPHLYFRDREGNRLSTYSTNSRFNANMDVVKLSFPMWNELSENVWMGRKGDVGYLAVHSWGGNEMLPQLDQAMEALRDTRALIVDVRANGGGIETTGRHVAAWFIDGTQLYAKHRFRSTESEDGWGPVGERYVGGNPPEKSYAGNVVVLQGEVCLSSNEAFLLMMRCGRRVTTMGATSGGSSANPRSFELPNGITVVLPRWQSLRPDLSPIEGVGIPPDVAVDGTFQGRDEVLEAAFRMLDAQIAPEVTPP